MKFSFIEFVRSAFGRRDEKFRKQLSVFLVCLVISIIIWLTVKLSNEYDTVIVMPVEFVHIPKNKVMTFVSDSVLQVEVLEKGSALFRMLYLQKTKPVAISLRFTPLFIKNNEYSAMVIPSLLVNEIEREHDLLGKIVSVSPDTIYLKLEPEITRKLPVTASFDLGFEKQYYGYGHPIFDPDSVTVKGPGRIIDQMDSARLEKISMTGLKENITVKKGFSSDSTNRLLVFNPDQVSVTIPVEKFTESEIEASVTIINSGDLRIKTFPEKVRIIYNVALKDYKEVRPGMVLTVADFSTVDPSRENKVKVRIAGSPEFIHIKKIEPEKVEFIIVK